MIIKERLKSCVMIGLLLTERESAYSHIKLGRSNAMKAWIRLDQKITARNHGLATTFEADEIPKLGKSRDS